MARIRSIHPGLFTDEAYMSLSMAAKAALPALWTQCDDQGVFEWKPVVLKARIFPADDVDMAALLAELEANDCIKSYQHNAKQFGVVRNFNKWQRPKKPSHVYWLPDELREFAGNLTDDEDRALALRKAKFDEAGGRCFYCGTEVTYYSKRHNSMELDHFIPKAKGGSDDPSNLRCACRSCNRSKCDMDAKEFFAFLSQRDESAKEKIKTAKQREAPAKEKQTPLMEDGGGRREDGGDNLALASEIARAQKAADAKEAQEGSTLVTPDDPPHWATIQTTLATRTADLDVWETDFLHSIKWARDLTKPQREKLDTIIARLSAKTSGSDPASPAARTRVPIVVGTDQWKAWDKHLHAIGKRMPINLMEVKDAEGRRIGRGWYFDSEWPPPASDAAA